MNIFARRVERFRASAKSCVMPHGAGVIDFSSDLPDLAAETRLTAEACLNEAVKSPDYNNYREIPASGSPSLISKISEYLSAERCLGKDDGVVITSGLLQSVEIIGRCICESGDAVILPELSMTDELIPLLRYGARFVEVGTNSDGINIESLENALKENRRTAFIYLTPSFGSPSGMLMSRENRKEVMALSEKYNVCVVENDSFGKLGYTGFPLTPLKSLDTSGRVIYIGSTEKYLPFVGISYISADRSAIARFTLALEGSVKPSALYQNANERFFSRDNEAFFDLLRDNYKRKCELMLNSLKFSMPLSIKFSEPEGGYYILCTLPSGDLQTFCKKAADNNVAILPGSALSVNEPDASLSFRLSFSAPTDEEIEKGVDILSKAAQTLYKA